MTEFSDVEFCRNAFKGVQIAYTTSDVNLSEKVAAKWRGSRAQLLSSLFYDPEWAADNLTLTIAGISDKFADCRDKSVVGNLEMVRYYLPGSMPATKSILPQLLRGDVIVEKGHPMKPQELYICLALRLSSVSPFDSPGPALK